jgi:allophanate hydrolase subunit 2
MRLFQDNMNGAMNKTGSAIILKPGIQSSIQDAGRFQLTEYGVPHSGAMDLKSFNLANSLLGNDLNTPCIEIGVAGCTIQFLAPTELAFYGANSIIFKNETKIPLGKRIKIDKEDVVEVKQILSGNWLYLAVAGGFIGNLIGKSMSWYFPMTPQSKLVKNDVIYFPIFNNHLHVSENHSILKPMVSPISIKAWKGSEWFLLNDAQKNNIKNTTFSVSSLFNRMAYQLNERIPNELKNILSSPTFPGTIQLTPSGTLIVLMKDAQVTGGYPRILQLDEENLNLLAQKKVGEKFKFDIYQY